MIEEVLHVSLVICVVAYGLEWALGLKDDPREPPRIRSKFPLLGHIFGLMRHGPTYYNMLSASTGYEIYTLDCGEKHGDASDETYEIFKNGVTDQLSHSVLLNLVPGKALDDMNLKMAQRVLLEMEDLMHLDGTTIKLLEWARHAVIQATSCAIYGVKHPFRSPEVERSFWKWQKYLTAHLVGWADVTGAGYSARSKVFSAYEQYCRQFPPDVSKLQKDHTQLLTDAGISKADAFKQAAIFTIASFSNSAPTTYWMIWELFSRPTILREVRSELVKEAVSGSKKEGFILDVAALKTRCHLLLSMLQETQRHRHVNPSFRKVQEDTLLDGKYLLKAGNFLQIPGHPIHKDTSAWGEHAADFDPYRFVPEKANGDHPVRSPASFVVWGSAPYLCPARQFAATEILVIAALLAMRVDLVPIGGQWPKSPALNYAELATLSNPLDDIEIGIAVRSDWEGQWSLMMGESKTRISLASG